MIKNHWKKYQLREVVEFLDHLRQPVTESDRKAGPYPYYGANAQQGWIDGFIFDEPLILLAEDGGNFGSKTRPIAYAIEGKTWVNNHAHVLRPRPGFDLRFLLRSLEFRDVSQLVKGATRAKLNKRDAETIELQIPDLPEQIRVRTIIDKAVGLRHKRREALHLADDLLRAVFIDMFGDPVSNPKGWPVMRLDELGTLDRGVSKHRPRNDPSLLGGKHPLIQTGEVANCDGYIRSYTNTYSDKGLSQSKLWPAGTLCITIAANIAKTGILLFPACFPDSVVGFSAEDTSTIEYVRFWLSFLQKTLEANAPESAQKNINLAILRELEIPVPPTYLIEKFAAIVLATETIRVSQQIALRESSAVILALLDELIPPPPSQKNAIN